MFKIRNYQISPIFILQHSTYKITLVNTDVKKLNIIYYGRIFWNIL